MARLDISTLLFLSLTISYVVASSYPTWLVLVTVKCNKKVDRCLGALVADNEVVTAARCFDRCAKITPTVRVYTGLGKSSSGTLKLGKKTKKTKVIIHPDYNSSTKAHDVAVIKTGCLSSNMTKLQPVNDCSLFSKSKKYSFCDLFNRKTLVEYEVARFPKKHCLREHKGIIRPPQTLCFKKSRCSDNSVGLTVKDNKLFALSRFGLECPSDGGQEPYKTFASLNICHYSSWIQKQTASGGNNYMCTIYA